MFLSFWTYCLGSVPPLTILDEHGVLVVLHFGKESPRPDVSVYVIMTTSKNQFPLTDYLFQPVVPKVRVYIIFSTK